MQPRAERARSAILDASRKLFLDRGYAGTSVNAITEACGISRAGFYTYFGDKREVFGLLGDVAYRDLRRVLTLWKSFARPYRVDDVDRFVRAYFAYMDRHGAFALAATHSAPDDEAFKAGNRRMQTRIAWTFGRALSGSGAHSPEVLGSAALGLLDRSWDAVRTQAVRVDEDEMIAVLVEVLFGMATDATRPAREA